ncbi:DUF680 domain-containing protein, partial [Mesorhizobium sp. M1329]|uniref:DUF680 domain-containing protein n=1 Tax=Mesorhizobium sp. M1329 TaxID=2957083 RepID=UPI0033396198
MKKIVLAAAALLIAAGSAYARNDNVGGTDINKQATVNVDKTQTYSVRDSNSPIYKLLNSSGDVPKWGPRGGGGGGGGFKKNHAPPPTRRGGWG